MSSGVLQTVLPIAGAAAGFFMGGGPTGAMAGYQLGNMASGAISGGQEQQAAPGQMQQVAPGVIQPAGGGLSLSGIPGSDKGAFPEMNLTKAPGGDSSAKSAMIQQVMQAANMTGEMSKAELARKLVEAQTGQANYRAPIMPSGVSPGAMGSYGPATGMRYL